MIYVDEEKDPRGRGEPHSEYEVRSVRSARYDALARLREKFEGAPGGQLDREVIEGILDLLDGIFERRFV